MREEDRKALLRLIDAVEATTVRELARCVAERRMVEFWSGMACAEALLSLEVKLTGCGQVHKPSTISHPNIG